MSENAKPIAHLITPEVLDRFWPKVAMSERDGCWLWTSYAYNGYGRFMLNSKARRVVVAHRLAYVATYGEPPERTVIDHICFQGLCCNPSHLRAVPQRENSRHLRGARSTSRSGIRGVTWVARRNSPGRWRVIVGDMGRKVHIGYFDDLAEAESAARDARSRIFGPEFLEAS